MILEAGQPDAALKTEATSLWAAIPSRLAAAGFTPQAAPSVVLEFSDVSYSFASLQAARLAIVPSLSDPGVFGVGLDEANNRVLLDSDGSPVADTEVAKAESEYGGMIETRQEQVPTVRDGRFSDSLPWNGGDEIVGKGSGIGCSTGFGVHSTSSGHHYILTAGHCGTDYWYNEQFSPPGPPNTFPLAWLIGPTLNGSRVFAPGNTRATASVDSQLIDPGSGSSSCISWGAFSIPGNPFVRYYVNGYNDPGSGDSVLLEGSYSLEKPTTVVAAPVTFAEHEPGGPDYWVKNGIQTVQSPASGDSGGPIVEPSIYGYLAAGMITAGSNTDGFGQLINSLDFVYQTAPNTSPSSSHC